MRRTLHYLTVLVLTISTAELVAEPRSPIGALAELTGAFARQGEMCRQGYEVAKGKFPHETAILFGDNQNDPKIGIAEFRRITERERATIVVTTRSPVGLALNPLSRAQKIPLIGVVGHPRFIGENEYAVRVFPSAEAEARMLASYVNLQRESTFGIITLEDEYFVGLSREFEAHLTKGRVVISESVAPSHQDLSSLLMKFKAAAPDAIFANLAPSQLAPFMKRFRELHLTSRVYSNSGTGWSEIRAALGELGDGIVFPEMDYRRPNFLRAVRELTGRDDTSPIGYSCYAALTYALTLAHRLGSSHPLPADLTSLTTIETLDGPLAFRDRAAQFTIGVRMLKDGEVMTLLDGGKNHDQ